MRTQNTSQIGRVAVHAPRRFDRRRFKAGWALDAMQHIAKQRSAMAPVSQPAHEYASQETGVQETRWALEDLWTRLSMCTALTIERDGDIHRLVLPAFRNAREGALAELRNAAFDRETYKWRNAGGLRGEFVSMIDYRGDDLVCTLTRSRSFEAWPDGEELVWQVKAFLLRLERSTAVGRCA
jgi:hypothetical protein